MKRSVWLAGRKFLILVVWRRACSRGQGIGEYANDTLALMSLQTCVAAGDAEHEREGVSTSWAAPPPPPARNAIKSSN